MNRTNTDARARSNTFPDIRNCEMDWCVRVCAEDKRHVCGILGYDTETIQRVTVLLVHVW